MADTFTPKLGLRQYDASLFYDVAKISADNLAIDNALGTVICTSTTRPSTGLFNGMNLWETDTQRWVVRVAGAWVAAPAQVNVANQAARDAIVTKYDGQMVYRQDRDWIEMYEGGSGTWRVQGTAVCSSVADRNSAITTPYNGQLAVTTDTNTLWQRVAGTWTAAQNRLIAFSERITPSAGTSGSTPMGVRRLDNVVMRLGCAYRIYTGTLHPTSTVSTDNLRIEIRYNNAGFATAASTILPGAQAYEAFGNTTSLTAYYVPAADETCSFALCVARDLGTGVASMHGDTTRRNQMFVEEVPLVANTGTNM